MKRIIFIIFLSILLAGQLPGREIIIGGLVDLSGPTSKVGVPYFKGIRDYFNFVNKGNILPWVKIKFIYEDTKYNPEKAVAEAKKLIKKGAVAIIGWGTGSSFKLKHLMEKSRVVYIPASLCGALLEPPDNLYIFLTASSYASEINTILNFIHHSKTYSHLSVGIVTNPSDFGMKPMKYVNEYARGKVHIDFIYPLSLHPQKKDIDELKKVLAKYKSPIIIVHSVPGPFVAVINATKEIPDYKPLAFFGTFYTYTHSIIDKISPDLIPKVYTINHFALWYENTSADSAMLRYFYEKKYHSLRREVYYTEGMVNAMIITLALQKVKGEITGESLRKALESFRNVSTKGMTPPISFSPTDHVAVEKLRILKINRKKKIFVPITGWVKP